MDISTLPIMKCQTYFTYLSVASGLPACLLSTCLSTVYLTIYLTMPLSANLSTYQSIYLSTIYLHLYIRHVCLYVTFDPLV